MTSIEEAILKQVSDLERRLASAEVEIEGLKESLRRVEIERG